jgi:hypothetical protein
MHQLVGALYQQSMNIRPVSAKKQNAFQTAEIILPIVEF